MKKIILVFCLGLIFFGCENNLKSDDIVIDLPNSSYFKKKGGKVYFKREVENLIEIEGADYDSFEALDNFVAKDKNFVYVSTGKIEKIKGVDVESFRRVDHEFSWDKNNVYCDFNKIENVDRETFEIYKGRYYAKDEKHCYYCGRDIEIVDMSKCDEVKKVAKDRSGLSKWWSGTDVVRIKE